MASSGDKCKNSNGGRTVHPRDVEAVLYGYSKITEAVVIGTTDLYRVEKVKAFVVLKEGETATSSEIIRFCRERLPEFEIPDVVEIRESLPKTMVGKVLRRVLIDKEINKES